MIDRAQLHRLITQVADPSKVSPFSAQDDMITLTNDEMMALAKAIYVNRLGDPAKEAQRMHRLEVENRELRERIAKNMEVYGDQLILICELKAKLELVETALYGGGE